MLYGAGAKLKRAAYAHGISSGWRPPKFCVSVGNISWGGTGKTPVVDWLLNWCESNNIKAAVLTRGYRSKPPCLPFTVQYSSSPEECGDEPLMLAKKHPESAILVDPERQRAGKKAMEERTPDIFILDDGFQHLRVQRDINLVLLDKDDVFISPRKGSPKSSWNLVMPAGTWREPQGALSAADVFLIKTTPEEWPGLVPDLQARLQAWNRPVFAFCMSATNLRPLNGAKQLLSHRQMGPYLFATGIGCPEQALSTAAAFLESSPACTAFFPDHHDFRREKDWLEAKGIPLVCTEKDAVKIERLNLSIPCYALETSAKFFASLCPGNNENDSCLDFAAWLQMHWHEHQQKKADFLKQTDSGYEKKRIF